MASIGEMGYTWMLAHHEETGSGKRAHVIPGQWNRAVIGKAAICLVEHPGGGCWAMLAADMAPVYCERCLEALKAEHRRDASMRGDFEPVPISDEYHGGAVIRPGMRLVITLEGYMVHVAYEQIP